MREPCKISLEKSKNNIGTDFALAWHESISLSFINQTLRKFGYPPQKKQKLREEFISTTSKVEKEGVFLDESGIKDNADSIIS